LMIGNPNANLLTNREGIRDVSENASVHISDRYELIAVDETGQQTGIDCCSSIDECLKLIEKIEEAFDDESGVLDLRVD